MKRIYTNLLMLVIAITLFAQAPQKFSYQAVVRDATGKLMTNRSVGVQISILQGSPNGSAVFVERHTATTNINGLATLEIGNGTATTGTLAGINWAAGPYYIKSEIDIDGGTVYKIAGTNELLSVPYALFSASGVPGPKGDTGAKGEKGDVGPAGPQGPKGDPGTGSGSSNTWTLKSFTINSNGAPTIDGTAGSGGPISSTTTVWTTTGNSISSQTASFIGTTDNKDLVFKRNNTKAGFISSDNTAFGNLAMNSSTAAGANTAFGSYAMQNIGDGIRNVAMGMEALTMNKTGNGNSAIGFNALRNNSTAAFNTAVGYNAMKTNTTGFYNSAFGSQALLANSSGSFNCAFGNDALVYNMNSYNSAFGFEALNLNTFGQRNTAVGYSALNANTTGQANVAVGNNSLLYNNTGGYNVAVGHEAMTQNTIGTDNTAIGNTSLYSNTTGTNNTALGNHSLAYSTSASFNTAIGNNALAGLSTGSNNIGIGNGADVPTATGSNQIRIGNTAITYAGVQVAWTITSDNRWKSNIRQTELGLDFIKKLNPVSYYRNNDSNKKTEYGFIAQEVEETLNKSGAANNGIISKDDSGLYSMRYNDLIAPMVKAIQEQQEKIEILMKRIEQLEKEKLNK